LYEFIVIRTLGNGTKRTMERPHGIAFFELPKGWNIQVLPPFNGALCRFNLKKGRFDVSVYYDANESLGYNTGKPYWEAYPIENDTYRVGKDELDELLNVIYKDMVKREIHLAERPEEYV